MGMIESDEKDKSYLSCYFGGNGDMYISITDESGIHAVRICTSGGHVPHEIKGAIHSLVTEFEKLNKEE